MQLSSGWGPSKEVGAGWVAPAEPEALAAALPAARDGASALAPVARARYERMFHPDVVTRRLIEVYEETATAALPSSR